MPHSPSIIERAYQIARSGSCRNVQDLVRKLKEERFESVEAHLAGPGFRRELGAIIKTCKVA